MLARLMADHQLIPGRRRRPALLASAQGAKVRGAEQPIAADDRPAKATRQAAHVRQATTKGHGTGSCVLTTRRTRIYVVSARCLSCLDNDDELRLAGRLDTAAKPARGFVRRGLSTAGALRPRKPSSRLGVETGMGVRLAHSYVRGELPS